MQLFFRQPFSKVYVLLHGNFYKENLLFSSHTRHDVTQMLDNKAWLLSHKKRELENHLQFWTCSNFQVISSTNYTSLPEPISKIRTSELNFPSEMTKEGVQSSKDFINETESSFDHTLTVDCPSLQTLDINPEYSTISGTLATYLGNVPSLVYHKRLSNKNNYACVDGDLTRVST